MATPINQLPTAGLVLTPADLRYDLGTAQTISTASTEWQFSAIPASGYHYEIEFDEDYGWCLYTVADGSSHAAVETRTDSESGEATDTTVTFPSAFVTATLVAYGAATMADRTANAVAITAALDELRITFPAATGGKVRDFEIRIEVGTGSGELTAPAIVCVAPTGETITLENPDGSMPAIADGAEDAKGVTVLYFSETVSGKFLCKGEEVKEVE